MVTAVLKQDYVGLTLEFPTSIVNSISNPRLPPEWRFLL
jgi:hypothetical protein